VTFSAVFFAVFTYSERRVARERHGKPENLDQFRVYGNQELGSGALGVRPGNILVAVRDPRNLYYLREVLRSTDTTRQDVVVMTGALYHREDSFGDSSVVEASQIFDPLMIRSFSRPWLRWQRKKASRFRCWCTQERMCSKPSF